MPREEKEEEDNGGWRRRAFFRGDATGGVEHSFDELARALAENSISRRRALKLAGASLLGAAGLLGSAAPAEAAATCPGRRAGCNVACTNTPNPLIPCFCIKTTSNDRTCVYPCCSDVPCREDSDCRSTEVCMKTHCCSPEKKTCVTKCDEPVPDYC